MDKRPEVSVIIVSYNCLPVLRLMLTSLRISLEGIDGEVFVVDNASSDGTSEYLKEHYDWITTIASTDNNGFSKANNMALSQCRGKVVLLLNPDTIISRTFVREIISHFEQHPESGAVGVQMVNGRGLYLRESKRGYTDVQTSFYKITGLWRFFRKSSKVNAYYMGHVDRDIDAKVPILSGACMAFTHELLDKVGMFDESYFMYGEDIDLSWRMNMASEGNMYLGTKTILHFKGMSTPRKLKYILAFYKAMELFARRYEFPKHNWFVNGVVLLGIKMGCLLGCLKCILLRIKDKFAKEYKPKKVTFVSTSSINRDAFALKNKDIVVYLTDDISHIDAEVKHVVFDVEEDLNKALGFMRQHGKQHLYAFYSKSEDLIVPGDF